MNVLMTTGENKRGWVIKLDLEEAFDRTDCEFFDFIMARKGFASICQKWIDVCLYSSHFSILRQGDHLSPFLFTLVVDSLGQLLSKREKESLFLGFRIGSKNIHVSDMQFVNNTLFFLEEIKNSSTNFPKVIQ